MHAALGLASTALSPMLSAPLRSRACRAELMQAERASDWSVTLDRPTPDHSLRHKCQGIKSAFRQAPNGSDLLL